MAILDEIAGHRHEVQSIHDGDFRFEIGANKATVAQAVARMVAEIDYTELMRSLHFSFGQQPGFMLMVTPDGLEVARMRPE